MAKLEKIKVLVADDDEKLADTIRKYITKHGFEVVVVNNVKKAKEVMKSWKPRLVLSELMLPGGNGLSLISHIQTDPDFKDHIISVLLMSGHASKFNVKQAFEKGAKDYIVKPFQMENLLQRLIFHCRNLRSLNDLKAKDFSKTDEASLMLYLTDLVLRQATSKDDTHEKLFKLTQMVTSKVKGVRCSVVDVLNQNEGIVVTSHDDRKATGIRLDLNKYPEVLDAYNREQLIAIEDIDENQDMKVIRKYLKDIMFNAMIICPVKRGGRIFGVLSLRLPKEKEKITENELRFVEIVAHVAGLILDQNREQRGQEYWHVAANERPIPISKARKS